MKGISYFDAALGFKGIRIHYSADEDKDPSRTEKGAAWLKEARQGIPEARWKKEYEMDFLAMGGGLLFPEFDPGVVLCEPFELNPSNWSFWMGCDPHPQTGSAFLYLAVDRNKNMVILFSYWKEEHAIVKEYVDLINFIEEGPVWALDRHDPNRPKLDPNKIFRVMDVAGKGFNADEEHNYFDAYREAGVYFREAKKNRNWANFDLIREAIIPVEYIVGNTKSFRPRLRIFDTPQNRELLFQFRHARWTERKTNTDKDAPEKPEDKRRHLLDTLGYILADDPTFVSHEPGRDSWVYNPNTPSTGL